MYKLACILIINYKHRGERGNDGPPSLAITLAITDQLQLSGMKAHARSLLE